jgi:hypothetical protein
MNLIINEKLIKRNKTIGNVLSIGGIAILGVGLVLNFNPSTVKTLISFGALIIGFILSQISTYYVSRFGRSPRLDEIVSENLDKLGNEYSLYVYSSPVPMLLVGPAGLWLPIPNAASGEIYYDKKWRQHGGSALMKLSGHESIGKPEMDAAENEKNIRKVLAEHFEEDEMPPINNVIALVNPEAKIGDIENAPTLIYKVNALRRKIKKFDRDSGVTLSQQTLEKINDLFSE